MVLKDKKGMLDGNEAVIQRIGFFEENSFYFRKLQKTAKDISKQNVPILVYSKDVLFRKWFSELVCFEKFRNLNCFECIPCSVCSDGQVVQILESLSPNSCVLLDRVDRLSFVVQEKLLDFLKSGFFDNGNISVVAASSENLERLAEQKLFSESLCFRLNFLKVNIPSLNENRSEIVPLARYFLEAGSRGFDVFYEGFSDNALASLENHFWSGEASELKNVVERAIIFGEPPVISANDFGFDTADSNVAALDIADALGEDKSLRAAVSSFKRYYVKRILEENGNNQTKSAKVLRLQRTYVARLMNELNLR